MLNNKRIKRFLLVLCFSVFGSGLFFFNTERGLNCIFVVISKVLPGKLTAAKITGTLSSSINVENLSFINNDIDVSVDKLQLVLKPRSLIFGELPISKCYAADIIINMQDNGSAPGQFENKNFAADLKSYLVKLHPLKDIQLHNITLQHVSARPVKLQHLFVQTEFEKNNVNFLKVDLKARDATVLIQGKVNDVWDITWQLDVSSLEFLPDSYGTMNAKGQLSGVRQHPTIDATLESKSFNLVNKVSGKNCSSTIHIDLNRNKESSFVLRADSFGMSKVQFDRLHMSGIVKSNVRDYQYNLIVGETRIKGTWDDVPHFLHLKQATINGNLMQNKALSSKILLYFAQYDPLEININVDKLYYDLEKFHTQPLRGELTCRMHDLRFLQELFPAIKNIRGELDIQYKFLGTMGKPRVEGVTKISQVSLALPEVNINLSQGNFRVQNNGSKISYTGSCHGDQGFFNLSGEALFAPENFNGHLIVMGENFLFANTQQYHVVVSPQLTLKFDNHKLAVDGTLSIPQATIKPQEFSAYNILPTELTYVGVKKNKNTAMDNLYANIKLILGDDVHINIMGLSGKVAGELQVIDDPQKSTIASGKLSIKDAFYNIYSKKLKVVQGEMHFLGGPIIDPEVNFKAIREINFMSGDSLFKTQNKDYVVGVNISGMLRSPNIKLFSEPAGLGDADILSYLVLGQSVANVEENHAQLLLQAGSAMNLGGAGKSGNFVAKLKEKLGFSEFGFVQEKSSYPVPNKSSKLSTGTVDGQKDTDSKLGSSTAFVLGRYLSPKLYVSYGNKLVEGISVLRIKYLMSKYFSLCVDSSSEGSGGLDLIYSVER